MNNKLLKFLVCPVSKDRLVFDKKNNMLVSKKAKLAYSIKEGIPILLKEQAKQLSTFSMSNNENAKSPEMSFDKQWILKKLKLLEPVLSSGKMPIERYNKILKTFNIKSFKKNTKFLDAGCGNGINGIEVAKHNPDCMVFMTDVSIEGLMETKRKAKGLKNVYILQSDLHNLAFKESIFDYVWSEGVLHHTYSTLKALISVEKTLKKQGMIYIWLYANYKKSYYLFVRDVFFIAYKLPFWAIYILSVLLSIPYYFFNLIHVNLKKILAPSTKRLLKERPLSSIIFSTYDSLNPRYQYRHSKEEATSWFKKLKYKNIRIVGDLGVVAKKN